MDAVVTILNTIFPKKILDYVKLDGCYSHPVDMDRGTCLLLPKCFWKQCGQIFLLNMFVGYPEFGYYLNRTGRPMMYSCSWPVYQIYSGIEVFLDLTWT